MGFFFFLHDKIINFFFSVPSVILLSSFVWTISTHQMILMQFLFLFFLPLFSFIAFFSFAPFGTLSLSPSVWGLSAAASGADPAQHSNGSGRRGLDGAGRVSGQE